MIELVRDNKGLNDSSADFRTQYENTNDDILGKEAPEGMFIATSLNQTSVTYSEDTILEIIFNGTDHAGEWIWRILSCIDRRQEELGSFDCAQTNDLVKITIIDLCQEALPEGRTPYPECGDDPIKPVEPDEPDDPDESDEEEDKELKPLPVEGNTAPILLDFDPNDIIKLKQGSTIQFDIGS